MARAIEGVIRVLKRAAAIAAGVVLGAAVIAGASAWQSRPPRIDGPPAAPVPVHRERAPDPRA